MNRSNRVRENSATGVHSTQGLNTNNGLGQNRGFSAGLPRGLPDAKRSFTKRSAFAGFQPVTTEITMKKSIVTLLVCLLTYASFGQSTSRSRPADEAAISGTVLPASHMVFREIRYDGRLADDEARFTLDVDAEADGRKFGAVA